MELGSPSAVELAQPKQTVQTKAVQSLVGKLVLHP